MESEKIGENTKLLIIILINLGALYFYHSNRISPGIFDIAVVSIIFLSMYIDKFNVLSIGNILELRKEVEKKDAYIEKLIQANISQSTSLSNKSQQSNIINLPYLAEANAQDKYRSKIDSSISSEGNEDVNNSISASPIDVASNSKQQFRTDTEEQKVATPIDESLLAQDHTSQNDIINYEKIHSKMSYLEKERYAINAITKHLSLDPKFLTFEVVINTDSSPNSVRLIFDAYYLSNGKEIFIEIKANNRILQLIETISKLLTHINNYNLLLGKNSTLLLGLIRSDRQTMDGHKDFYDRLVTYFKPQIEQGLVVILKINDDGTVNMY